jgi:hypothetical protein
MVRSPDTPDRKPDHAAGDEPLLGLTESTLETRSESGVVLGEEVIRKLAEALLNFEQQKPNR